MFSAYNSLYNKLNKKEKKEKDRLDMDIVVIAGRRRRRWKRVWGINGDEKNKEKIKSFYFTLGAVF